VAIMLGNFFLFPAIACEVLILETRVSLFVTVLVRKTVTENKTLMSVRSPQYSQECVMAVQALGCNYDYNL